MFYKKKFRNFFINNGGKFYSLEYKGDGIQEILSSAANVVSTNANVVSGSAKIAKSF